ncbi:MAG: hypothetical protein AAGB26_17625 [Planctomycetota bacterium]
MPNIISVFIALLFLTGCSGSDEWETGPIKTLGLDEKDILKESFYIGPGARDLRLYLKGGKDYTLYAQWYSDIALIDTDSPLPVFELQDERTMKPSISPHKPSWWGLDQFDHVYYIGNHHAYIGVLELEDGSYQYEAVRYLALPFSVYRYFE